MVSETCRSEIRHHFEVIQQWQYTGNVNPLLLTENAFRNGKRSGITSVQSYVTWAQIEPRQGRRDFSAYDELVGHLQHHNLKWVPFLILGPNYATPDWFQKSDHSLHAICLEHRKKSKIQSIWNPHLPRYVDHFLRTFANHYSDHDIFESIALGISGNWGEALYPATGGFRGGFHTHPGWWCGDERALLHFREHVAQKNGSITTLNKRWGTNFKDFSAISFPEFGRSLKKDGFDMLRNRIPGALKPVLSRIRGHWEKIRVPRISSRSHTLQKMNQRMSQHDLQYRIDFTAWYQNAMTRWAQYWVERARYHFANTALYLVTGGNGRPMLGADFASQTKMAKKYNAGIRITNQNDSYRQSFIFTRLVSAACRNYGTYFTTEESGVNRPHGVTMRIFDAATSGASGAYFKSIIGNDSGPCGGPHPSVGEPGRGAKNLSENLRYISPAHPIVDVAVLFPNTTIAIMPSVLNSLYQRGGRFRALADFDLVDENMIGDNLLQNYRFLALLEGGWIGARTTRKILDWITGGGILITGSHLSLKSIENRTDDWTALLSLKGIYKRVGQGYSVCFSRDTTPYLRKVSGAVYNRDREYPWQGIPSIPDFLQGQYVTRFTGRLMSYDPKKCRIQIHEIKDDNDLSAHQ